MRLSHVWMKYNFLILDLPHGGFIGCPLVPTVLETLSNCSLCSSCSLKLAVASRMMDFV